jgi:putative membrane protein
VNAVDPRGPLAWLALVLVALAWSGVHPADRATWWAEALPVMIGVPILVATFRRHPLTPLLYGLIAVHCLILVVGARGAVFLAGQVRPGLASQRRVRRRSGLGFDGPSTSVLGPRTGHPWPLGHRSFLGDGKADRPSGFWMQDWFGFERNHYDRIGHLAQGFVPAILAREVLLRATPLRRGGWLFYLVLCVCLSFSAFYELIEWVAAETAGQGAEAFLGTQGDEWDAQKDMLLALLGAIAAQLLLAGIHDRQLARVAPHALAKGAGA